MRWHTDTCLTQEEKQEDEISEQVDGVSMKQDLTSRKSFDSKNYKKGNIMGSRPIVK